MEECRCRYCDCVAETTVQYVCEDCNINCYKGHGGTLRPCKNCAQEAVDPNFEWDENDLLTCGCCKDCGCDCMDWEKVVRKYMKRSGIRRIYSYKDVRKRGRLKLEFVLRGNVFFRLPLWRIKSMMKDEAVAKSGQESNRDEFESVDRESYAYCVRCKEKRFFGDDAIIKTSDSGRRLKTGICPTCGTKIARIIGRA